MKAHSVQQTKHQLRHKITQQGIFENTRNCIGPLNDENKLQVDERTKN